MTEPARPGIWICAVTWVRGVIGNAGTVAATVILSVPAVAAGALGFRKLADSICFVWGRFMLEAYGIEVRLVGEENFPPGQGCLLLFNHQSLFDIPTLYGTLRRTVRFGAKTELFKIPFFGPAMRAVGTLPIARDNRQATLQTYREAQEKFAQGFSYALAPEGTRQKEPAIGRFKAGPFIFAIGAQAPIVAAVIKGAHDVLPKKRLVPNVGRWRRRIYVQLLPAVQTRGLRPEDLSMLMDRVRASMVEAFAALPAD